MFLNPPYLQDEPTESHDSNNDGTLFLGPSEYSVQHPFVAEHISHNDMGEEGQDETYDLEERCGFLHDGLSEEDTDMSDGGAALTITASHAEQLNAELDMLDAEVMGSDNLVGILMDNHYQPNTIDNLPFHYHGYYQELPSFAQSSSVYNEGTMDDDVEPTPLAIPNFPVAMSAVAQQLQHIQDGQGHGNFTIAPDPPHTGVQDNSKLLLLFPLSSLCGYFQKYCCIRWYFTSF